MKIIFPATVETVDKRTYDVKQKDRFWQNSKYNEINPNLDKPKKWPQRHKDTKQDCLLKFIFVFWCLGGENVLPQNA